MMTGQAIAVDIKHSVQPWVSEFCDPFGEYLLSGGLIDAPWCLYAGSSYQYRLSDRYPHYPMQTCYRREA